MTQAARGDRSHLTSPCRRMFISHFVVDKERRNSLVDRCKESYLSCILGAGPQGSVSPSDPPSDPPRGETGAPRQPLRSAAPAASIHVTYQLTLLYLTIRYGYLSSTLDRDKDSTPGPTSTRIIPLHHIDGHGAFEVVIEAPNLQLASNLYAVALVST